jgi:hypothetical protein
MMIGLGLGLGGRAGGAEFDSASVGTVLFEIDSRYVTQGGGLVTAAADRSGNGNNATAGAGSEPTYEASIASYAGKPAIRFPASATKRLTTAAGAGSSIGTNAFTIVLVGHGDEALDAAPYSIAPLSGTDAALGTTSGTATWRQVVGVNGYSGTPAFTSPSVVVAVFNGASSKLYVNSRTAESLNVSPAHNVSDGWSIGNYGSAPAANLSHCGPILRVIVYPAALTNDQAASVLNGLGALYGVTISA